MRRVIGGVVAVLVVAGLLAVAAPDRAPAQAKKIVYWTHWEQNPEFNKWYETEGKEFAKKSGYEVEVVTIPYQGYEAKYLAALVGKSGAPDFFNGIVHQWCGQYDFCDRMPADLEKTWSENLPKYMLAVDRKSTRLNSSHVEISYAVFCLKKKKKKYTYDLYEKKKYKQKRED